MGEWKVLLVNIIFENSKEGIRSNVKSEWEAQFAILRGDVPSLFLDECRVFL